MKVTPLWRQGGPIWPQALISEKTTFFSKVSIFDQSLCWQFIEYRYFEIPFLWSTTFSSDERNFNYFGEELWRRDIFELWNMPKIIFLIKSVKLKNKIPIKFRQFLSIKRVEKQTNLNFQAEMLIFERFEKCHFFSTTDFLLFRCL